MTREDEHGWNLADPVVFGAILASLGAFAALTVAVGRADGATRLDLWLLERIGGGLLVWIHTFDWLGLLSTPHLIEGVFLCLFAYLGARSRWREAYLTLAIGPGGAGLVYLLQVGMRRIPPGGAPGRMVFSNYPNAMATLAPLLVLTGLLLFGRGLTTGRFFGGLAIGALYPAVISFPALFTEVWPTDLIAGTALGVSWFGLCLAGYVVATGENLTRFGSPRNANRRQERPVIERWLAGIRARLLALWKRASPYIYRRETLYALVAAGVLVRISTYWTYEIGFDANIYAIMGEAIHEHGQLRMPWGATYSFTGTPAPSHHYPPLYPAYLAGFYEVFGVSEATTQLAAIVSSLALLAVVYACTRDLYDHHRATITTAVVSVFPILIKTTGEAYSESLVLILFVLTMWAILRSLEEPPYIILAGLFAGLSYLAKSSMGYFFFLAGGAGFLWRLYWMGRELFEDRSYWIAVGVFGSIVATWAGRNYLVHGSWQTSEHLTQAYVHAAENLSTYVANLPIVFLFLLGLGYVVMMGLLPWFPWLKEIPLLDSEHDSGLWLALGLPLVLSTFVYSALWAYEEFFYTGATRYVALAVIPLTWLLLRHVDLSADSVKVAGTVSILLMAGGAAAYAVPYQPLYDEAPEDLGGMHQQGQTVAFAGLDGHGMYRFYLDLTRDGTKQVDVRPLTLDQADATSADWLVTKGSSAQAPAGYEVVERYRTHEPRLEPIVLWKSPSTNAATGSGT